ncbi:MAG: hypothetical protein EP343_07870 [Deltaproteobacteria bacterium]|nr:MAG: hypothetical protein EP343_07870 [Deltaproteobacteria bacterium]
MAVIFPRWTNKTPLILLTLGLGGGLFTIFGVWYWFSPQFTDVGYAPKQPVPFSHQFHAGTLGLDCRYCHYTVEKAGFAAIPPTQVCMGCHTYVVPNSRKIAVLKANHEAKKPVPWVRVHMLPDYAYFNHSVHVGAGVGCASCHGRIDKMAVVHQAKPLSMGWCLDCHRNPNKHLRPKDQVTNMKWDGSPEKKKFQADLKACLANPKTCKNEYIRNFIARRKDMQERRKNLAMDLLVRDEKALTATFKACLSKKGKCTNKAVAAFIAKYRSNAKHGHGHDHGHDHGDKKNAKHDHSKHGKKKAAKGKATKKAHKHHHHKGDGVKMMVAAFRNSYQPKTVLRHKFLDWKWPQQDPKQLFVNPPEHCSGCHR